ncbi:MAG: type II toxin-antitoxin system VapC family toxin [Asticcacaulis sp.]
MSSVLDASAVMALIMREPGEEKVRGEIGDAIISSVNMAEVYSTCADRKLDPAVIGRTLSGMGLAILNFLPAHAFVAGQLRPLTRSHGLSLGDRACLATAMVEKLPVMTADRAWLTLSLPVEVISIR